MTDIKVESGEIVLGYDDLEMVTDSDCLLQDIRTRLYTDIGALFYDTSYGAKVLRYIQGTKDQLLEIKQVVKIALKSDDRIVSNSIKVTTEIEGEELTISMEFTSTDGDDLELEISI